MGIIEKMRLDGKVSFCNRRCQVLKADRHRLC